MLRIPGLGPKKVKASTRLQIDTIEKLKAACESGEVAKQKGFGAKTQAKILEGIALPRAGRDTASASTSRCRSGLSTLRTGFARSPA